MSDFFNPYAFIPAPARDADQDAPPQMLGVLHDNCWTGTLRITMCAETPLLITEQDEDSRGKVTRKTRVIDGKPVLSPTSVKGMLRTEFEILTGSRMGVFGEHERPLGYRESASRQLYPKSPADLAAATATTPAETLHELSAADRLFGWVPPQRNRQRDTDSKALRGRVRIGAITAKATVKKGIDRGLAILGAPRPTQDLFYVAEDSKGAPLKKGTRGYRDGNALRGYKVYPHQPDTTWDTESPQQWLLHGTGKKDNKPDVGEQNALLKDWVEPGAELKCTIHVESLTADELGVLLYILRGAPDTKPIHKLGGGKPFGFGSVTIELDNAQLWTTEQWRDYYLLKSNLPPNPPIPPVTVPTGPTVPIYQAYLEGFPSGVPVHYPAQPNNPDSDEKRYEWFVANRGRQGKGLSLGSLTSGYQELRLPTNPSNSTNQNNPNAGRGGQPNRANGRRR